MGIRIEFSVDWIFLRRVGCRPGKMRPPLNFTAQGCAKPTSVVADRVWTKSSDHAAGNRARNLGVV